MAKGPWAIIVAAAIMLSAAYFLWPSHAPAKGLICPDCNVILISVDALRADHLGVYGYGRNTSGNIDRFAMESIVFDNAVTPRPKTNPSVTSMMTGVYPYRHGVRDPYVPMEPMKTLPSVLREHGLTAAAFVSNWLLQPAYSGLDRYFDVYDFDFRRPELNRANVFERNAAETNGKVFNWLEGNAGGRFFLWVHYMDPHGPYYPPQGYRNVFSAGSHDMVNESKLMGYQILPAAYVEDRGGVRYTDAQYYRDQYDNEVYYTDEQIGRLLAELDRLNLTQKTMIILTSDHGEGLGEHDYYFEHGREVYEDNARIPLIVRLPDGGVTGRNAGLVSNMDIYPTVLDLLNISVSEAGDIDGVSFLPLMEGKGGLRQDVFIERHEFAPYFERAAVRTKDLKLVMNGPCDPESILDYCKSSEYECYNLTADPKELNTMGCDSASFEALNKSLGNYVRAAQENGRTLGQATPSNDTEVLKSLGYIN